MILGLEAGRVQGTERCIPANLRRMAPSRHLGLLAVALFLCAGCASLPRPSGPEAPAWRDERVLDSTDADRLLVEIDRVAGTEPRPRALRLFMERLRFYTDKPGGIEVVVDDVIAADRYEPDSISIRRLARRVRSQRRAGQSGGATLHILYAPEYLRYRGYAWARPVMVKTAAGYDAALVLVLQDRLRSILWITGARQEASVLTHEFGHTLGLVNDPSHGMNGHCTNAWCSMYDGVDAATAFLYFFPTLFTGYLPVSFCGDCLADLYPDRVPPGRRR